MPASGVVSHSRAHPVAVVGACVLLQLFLGPVLAADRSDRRSDDDILRAADVFAVDGSSDLLLFRRRLYIEGEHSAVLNFSLLGLAAMQTGRYKLAEKAFDSAIVRIESIYASDPNAARAKQLWIAEKVKDFKGESHERAMVYFYRGILYARAGEYDNARASFLAADRHDGLAEQDAFRTDFGIMNFLAAWSSYCVGDETRGEDLMKRATTAQPEIFDGLSFKASFVGIIDSGVGPQKRAVGSHGEYLRYVPPSFPPTVFLNSTAGVAEASSSPILAGDVAWQAMTRGGRQLDEILKEKAGKKQNYEESRDVFASAASNSSSLAQDTNDVSMAGVSLLADLISSGSSKAAKKIKAEADTRSWTSLPADIYLVLGKLDGDVPPAVEFAYGAGRKAAATTLNFRSGKCGLSWGRTENVLRLAASLPQPEIEEVNRRQQNLQFRAMLESDFGAAAERP
jgi:tetratricopeptide (TPR) repeat protein